MSCIDRSQTNLATSTDGTPNVYALYNGKPLASTQINSSTSTRYYTVSDERASLRASYTDTGTAGDTSQQTRYGEYKQIDSAAIIYNFYGPVGTKQSELFRLRNVTISENTIALPSEQGNLEIGGINVTFEGTRVKSALIGRDFNPLGRGDGVYYFAGAMSTSATLPNLGSNHHSGTGNSVNNAGQCGGNGGTCNSPYPGEGFDPDDNYPKPPPSTDFFTPPANQNGNGDGLAAVGQTPTGKSDDCVYRHYFICLPQANKEWDNAYDIFDTEWKRINKLDRRYMYIDEPYTLSFLMCGGYTLLAMGLATLIWYLFIAPIVEGSVVAGGVIGEGGVVTKDMIWGRFGWSYISGLITGFGVNLESLAHAINCFRRVKNINIPRWEAYRKWDNDFIKLCNNYNKCMGSKCSSWVHPCPTNRFNKNNKPNYKQCWGYMTAALGPQFVADLREAFGYDLKGLTRDGGWDKWNKGRTTLPPGFDEDENKQTF